MAFDDGSLKSALVGSAQSHAQFFKGVEGFIPATAVGDATAWDV